MCNCKCHGDATGMQSATKHKSGIQNDLDKYGIVHMSRPRSFLQLCRRRNSTYKFSHEPLHIEGDDFVCRVCSNVFRSCSGLVMHMYKGHNM